jgi:hypothetical protein
MVCVLHAAQQAGVPVRAILLKAVKDAPGRSVSGFDEDDLVVGRLGPRSESMLTESSGPVFSFIDASNHVKLPLRRVQGASEPHFDFVLPEQPDLPLAETAEIVPYTAVREHLRNSMQQRIETFRKVADLTPGRLIQVESPPPTHDRWLQLWLRHVDVTEIELPPRFVRYKLWRIVTEIFREEAERVGARFVEYPPESVDANGFLRDELVRDMHHGNADFGALILERLRPIAEESNGQPNSKPRAPGSAKTMRSSGE